MQRRWLDTDSEHWIWFLVCVQGRRCQTWQHLRDKTSESWAQLWVSASPGGGGEVSVIIPHSSSCFLLGRDKVRALTSNCSPHCNLKWLTETFSSMLCVCAFFFCFYLFAPIAAFLVHELSSAEILTLKLYWVHILLAYSLHSRYIVVVGD